jgi:hypothetical protein
MVSQAQAVSCLAIGWIVIAGSIVMRGAASSAEVRFTDVIRNSGITFENASSPDMRYIVESMGGGVAPFDFDNDGLLDIYFLNSHSVEAALAGKPRPHAALYRNRMALD